MTGRSDAHTFDVRVWKIERYKGARGTTYAVRWVVQRKRHRRTFPTQRLAEAFRSELMLAAREGSAFDRGTGVPVSMMPAVAPKTWLEHAMAYVDHKWPAASPRHRKGIAEALTDITLAITPGAESGPQRAERRRALYTWAFNTSARQGPDPEELRDVIDWLKGRSPALASLNEAPSLHSALHRLALKQDGRPAAASTLARKRATLHNVLDYAFQLGEFPSNPLERVKSARPRQLEVVDRRVVVNPTQARSLLDAAWELDHTLAAFFGCLYYCGVRPAEARNLRHDDFVLPDEGWGSVLLTGSVQASGTAWTEDGRLNEERGLKHRARADTRPVPVHPELVAILRRHLETFECGVGGRLFVTRIGRAGVPVSPPYVNPVPMNTVYRAWQRARAAAFTPEQVASALARRPYDLRHACLSTWLNAGVAPARVARWAGHTVEVLLRVYANCVDGDDEVALRRIEAALRP